MSTRSRRAPGSPPDRCTCNTPSAAASPKTRIQVAVSSSCSRRVERERIGAIGATERTAVGQLGEQAERLCRGAVSTAPRQGSLQSLWPQLPLTARIRLPEFPVPARPPGWPRLRSQTRPHRPSYGASRRATSQVAASVSQFQRNSTLTSARILSRGAEERSWPSRR